ncbi:MAG: hypothetical protein RL139_1545 [Gemmatimonadota bacterium]|jgi:diguanylate cyclase (GGDEF)-like protein
MALPLDRFTLEVVLVAVTGLMTLMMANVWLTNRREPGVSSWFLTTVAGLIVFGLITGIDTKAGGAAPLHGARNIASFLLSLGLLGGVLQFRGRGNPRWWRVLAGVGAVFTAVMLPLHDDVRTRLVIFDIASIGVMGALALALAWRAPAAERRTLRFSTVAPLGLLGVLAMRLWTTWHAGPDATLPDLDAQNAVFLMTALFNITMTHTATIVLYQRAQDRTERLAMEDVLTGLLNRRAFEDRLATELARGARTRVPFALVLADVNDLKGINDRHGHHAGDRLLAALGSRLRAFARDADAAARLGGDECGVILTGIAEPQALAATIQRLRQAVEAPVEVAPGLMLDLSLSIGGTIWGAPAVERDALVGAADQALYADKARSHLARPS